MLRLLLAISFVFSLSSQAFSFPEMIRKGYPTCVSCHVSPSGGGVLTDYGRSISSDVLATWAYEGEENVLHGAVNLPEFLKIGGDIRRVQTYVNTPQIKSGRWFLMQANLEAAVTVQKWTLASTLDYDIQNPDIGNDDRLDSFRHYLMYQWTDEISLRAGKFLKNYGLGVPDHTAQIRRGTGMDQGSETYNAEFNYITQSYSLAATYVGGRPDVTDRVSDKGVALTGSYFFGDAQRVGGSFYQGENSEKTTRRVWGPNWALSYQKKLYWLGEADLVDLKPEVGDDRSGFVSYNRFGYELFKGADFYLVHEAKKAEFSEKYLDLISYGPGFMWSPRPHFILTGQWTKQVKPSADKPRTIDSAYLITQYSI